MVLCCIWHNLFYFILFFILFIYLFFIFFFFFFFVPNTIHILFTSHIVFVFNLLTIMPASLKIVNDVMWQVSRNLDVWRKCDGAKWITRGLWRSFDSLAVLHGDTTTKCPSVTEHVSQTWAEALHSLLVLNANAVLLLFTVIVLSAFC